MVENYIGKKKFSERIKESILEKPLKTLGIATIASLVFLGPCRILKYELDNRTTSGEGSATGTVQKFTRECDKIWGLGYVPFTSQYNGFLLLSKRSGMRKDDNQWCSIDRDTSINFNIADPRWPEDKRHINTQKELLEVLNMCEGKEGTIKFVHPKKKVIRIILPFDEKYIGDENTGYVETIRVFEKKVKEKYFEGEKEKTRDVVKKFKELKIDQWLMYSWRGKVSEDIREEDTYNRKVHLIREFIPGEECILKYSRGLESHILPQTKTPVYLPTPTTNPKNNYSTPTTISSTTTTIPEKTESKKYLWGLFTAVPEKK